MVAATRGSQLKINLAQSGGCEITEIPALSGRNILEFSLKLMQLLILIDFKARAFLAAPAGRFP